MAGDADQQVRNWLERELGGTVVAFERQQRWRPAWFASMSRGGTVESFYVRGSRGGNFPEMITLADRILVMREGRIAFEHRTKGDGTTPILRAELLAELGVVASPPITA